MGGDKEIEVTQPALAPTTADAVSAWVKSMPTVFAEQQRQAPLEAQQQLDLLRQYGLPLSQAIQGIDQSLYPQTSKLQENLAGIANDAMGATQIPEWMKQEYLNNVNANLGTNVGSPIAADYVSRGLLQQAQDWRSYYQNLGLSLAGRQPLTSAQSPQYTNYAAGFTPTGVGQYQMQGYNSYMPYLQNYQNQQGMLSMMPSRNERAGQMWGNVLMGSYGR